MIPKTIHYGIPEWLSDLDKSGFYGADHIRTFTFKYYKTASKVFCF